MELDNKYCTKTIAKFESFDGTCVVELYRRLEYLMWDGLRVAYVGIPSINRHHSRLETAVHYIYTSHFVVMMTNDIEVFRVEKSINLEFKGLLGRVVMVDQ